MIRNGVISKVRTIPRPKKCRSSSTASNVPRASEMSTVETVITTLVHAASRKNSLLTSFW
jgi:hypothetical protein